LPSYSFEKFSLLQKKILSLNNKSQPESRDYKPIVESIIKGIDKPVYNKLFSGIKKYQGRYEDELRYMICLNEQRKLDSQNKRQTQIAKLSEKLDKVFEQNTTDKEARDIDKAINTIFEGYKVAGSYNAPPGLSKADNPFMGTRMDTGPMGSNLPLPSDHMGNLIGGNPGKGFIVDVMFDNSDFDSRIEP
jgi:hypothetical protein